MLLIDQYWGKKFGLHADALYRPGIHVVPHVTWEDTFVYAFVRDTTCLLSVASSLLEVTQARTCNLEAASLLDPMQLQRLFDQRIERTVGPAYQGYADVKHFLPRQPKAVRIVRSEDAELVQQLKRACEPIAWEHSAIDQASSPLFAYYTPDGIVAIGHYSMWDYKIASIGVLTHPAYRRRGYAKLVVSAAMSDAFEHGYLVAYQTLMANTPAVAIATALGCQDYARTVAAYLFK